jgi:SAM-dependent methyltransferase
MTGRRPFLDYYDSLGAAPVSQDISDLPRHFERRNALYALLGIPPRFFSLAKVLEFGPGLGHNAIHVASLRPRRHVLVDAHRRGLKQLRATLRSHFGSLDRFEIVEATAEGFRSDAAFDIVLAENIIPFQSDPVAFCRAIATHVRSGGVLVVTCTTAVSFMGEILRRLIALKAAPPELELPERVTHLRDLFASHLARLPGVSRPVDDWIKDNITHPFVGRFFSVADAVEALHAGFDAYGASPHFVIEWRWYKQLCGAERRANERLVEAYRANILNLLDCRTVLQPQHPRLGERLEERCLRLFEEMLAVERTAAAVDFTALAERCEEIADIVRPVAARSAASISEVAAYLRASEWARPESFLDEFSSFFGRAVTYLSFIRR